LIGASQLCALFRSNAKRNIAIQKQNTAARSAQNPKAQGRMMPSSESQGKGARAVLPATRGLGPGAQNAKSKKQKRITCPEK
jgi:hypothetical protein